MGICDQVDMCSDQVDICSDYNKRGYNGYIAVGKVQRGHTPTPHTPLQLNESHGSVGRENMTQRVQVHPMSVALHSHLILTLFEEGVTL